MAPRTARKRAGKLLHQIFELQQYDFNLTDSFCLETKFLLRNTKYCTRVDVVLDRSSHRSVIVDRSLLPKFILSQLEAHKLITASQSRVTITPLLNFLLDALPSQLHREDSTPTFFTWQCPTTGRTCSVIAFVAEDLNMSSRSYTIRDLLRLRGTSTSKGLSALAERDPDLADVVTGAGGGAPAPKPAAGSKAKVNSTTEVKKVMDDSSTGSEEIVYKGNPSRRGMPQETEWKYRGRSGSETRVTEPLSAPTGLNAQLNEGFQRFYKAVVSPTHVRVTAGGRIVPNTRGSSSPTSKRSKDKAPADTQSTNVSQSAQGQTEGVPVAKGPRMPLFALPSPYYPPFPGQFAHLGAPVPMMPMPIGIGMAGAFPYPQAPFGSATNAASAPGSASKENKKVGDSEAAQAPESDKADSKVKISPPEQFDHTKPFMYNGQLMYPVPTPFPPQMGAHYMPPGFIGHPGYPVPQFSGPPLMAPPHAAMGPMVPPMNMSFFGPHSAPPAVPTAAGNANSGQSGTQSNPQPPSAPPISSIRPSDISRKQIDSLRHSLKYHEDQLQFNRHQIDEREMEKTTKMLQDQIDRFEKMNQAQLLYEEKYYPKRDKPRESTSSSGSHNPGLSKPSMPEEGQNKTTLVGASNGESLRKKDGGMRARPGINTSQNNQATYSFDPVVPLVKFDEPIKKSTLPSGAALAPPFEPRVAGGLEQGVTEGSVDGCLFTKDTHDSVERRLLAAGSGSWAGWNSAHAAGLPNGARNPAADDHHPTSSQDDGSLGRPYLVGKLPTGLTAQSARDADYVYERELTQDEIRARFLYWGKAPRFARRGLPKYDGKDFYPPSPEKGSALSASCQRTPVGMHDLDVSLNSSVASVTDPFRPATPVNGMQLAKRAVSNENTPPKQMDVAVLEERATSRMASVSENDAKSLEYNERRLGESSGRFLNNMLKRGITRSSDVLPSAVSSTTAHGFLPQYTGYSTLAASLSSAMISPDSSNQHSPGKSPDGGAFLTPTMEKRGENRRPLGSEVGPASLEEQFRNIVSLDAKNRSALPGQWKAT